MEEEKGAASARRRTELEMIFTKFLRRQRTMIRLLEYIEEKMSGVDDQRSALYADLLAKHPRVAPDLIYKIVDALEPKYDDESGNDDGPATKAVGRLALLLQEAGEEGVPVLLEAADRVRHDEPATPLMFSSLLTSLVGGFEMFIADLANYAYREFPAALSLSGASFTWQDVTSHSSIESLREQTIERAVNEMLRASFDDWLATFEKKFSVAVPSVVREVAVREVFQRRNLVVHNDSVVNELYREKVRGLPECPPVGVKLVVDAEYLRDAADRLWATAWHLAWAFGDKLIKGGDREIFEMFICNVPYRHLEDKRYRAIEFADCAHVVRSVKDEGNALILKVNVWLAKKRLGKFDECRDEIVAWQTAHLSPQYQLARLALLDQLEEGMALVEEIRYTKNLSFTSWYTWPLLEELREYELRLASGQKELEPPPQ